MSSHYSGQAGLVAGPKLTESDQDHLRAIYDAGGARAQIRMGRVAKVVGNSPATVTVAVKRLHARGLVDYERYKGVRLMPEGERLALEMVRHHRLIERFLVEFLGYDWKDVHEEADRLEHAISEELERRIAARVSDPTTDPHGEPIPTEALEAVDDEASTLTTSPSGQRVTVARVSDRDRAIRHPGLPHGDRPGAGSERPGTGAPALRRSARNPHRRPDPSSGAVRLRSSVRAAGRF